MRFQMKGLSRLNLYGLVETDVKIAVRKMAERHDCSMRLVINTVLADGLNIRAKDKYYEEPIQVSRVKKSNRTKKR